MKLLYFLSESLRKKKLGKPEAPEVVFSHKRIIPKLIALDFVKGKVLNIIFIFGTIELAHSFTPCMLLRNEDLTWKLSDTIIKTFYK